MTKQIKAAFASAIALLAIIPSFADDFLQHWYSVGNKTYSYWSYTGNESNYSPINRPCKDGYVNMTDDHKFLYIYSTSSDQINIDPKLWYYRGGWNELVDDINSTTNRNFAVVLEFTSSVAYHLALAYTHFDSGTQPYGVWTESYTSDPNISGVPHYKVNASGYPEWQHN